MVEAISDIMRLAPYLTGRSPWPNCREVGLGEAISIAAINPFMLFERGFFCLLDDPIFRLFPRPAIYFLGRTQRGVLDGSGFVMLNNRDGGACYFVAVCVHEKEVSATAIPARGYIPGKCRKCGLDMTVDSGD